VPSGRAGSGLNLAGCVAEWICFSFRMDACEKAEPGFVVCLKNEGYAASLERHKI
jgi:hypothetical protein